MGGVAYVLVAGVLAKLFGGSAVTVIARSVLLVVGGVFAVLASLLLSRSADIRLAATTSI
ncbi:hypothetical protein [Streptomyces sp. CT34]|uniref:hypothetical protein n=1 Tax=Streptomyces sp. CT34 TaxID=1553907 RepID=UPI0005BA4064|nr:hypothetical protein [Streptomyces sp. CT34]